MDSSPSRPAPIPFRPLLALLNYSQALYDPSFKSFGLLKTTLNDNSAIGGFYTTKDWPLLHAKNHISTHLKQLPYFMQQMRMPQYPPAGFRMHPHATTARNLSHRELDTLYHQTVAGNNCFEAAGLLVEFFKLFAKDQMFSVQLGTEELLISPSTMQIRLLNLHNFSTHITVTKNTPQDYIGRNRGPEYWETGMAPAEHEEGYLDYENHCVVWFPSGIPFKHVVIDLTRIQYGEAGRGTDGELYFVGRLDTYLKEMKGIAGGLVTKEYKNLRFEEEKEARLKESAWKAFKVWKNRDKMGWCAYCGRPRGLVELVRCGKCDSQVVGWCCKEHLEYDQKLHAHTCQKNTPC